MAPPDKDLEWNNDGLDGMWRFLGRAWRLVAEVAEETAAGACGVAAAGDGASKSLRSERHRVVGKVSEDVERFQFNTALSAMMELVNAAYDYRRAMPAGTRDLALERDVAETLTLLLSPYVPHMAEELWREVLGHKGSVHLESWPAWDPSAAVSDEIEYAVQVNGKVRAHLTVAADAPTDEVQAAALALEKVVEHTAGKTVRKVVVVPGKLISIVVG